MPYGGLRKSPTKKTGKKYVKKLNRSPRRSRSRSLRGGNRFQRSLLSLREKLRDDQIKAQQELERKKLLRWIQTEQELEALYVKLDKGLLPLAFSKLTDEKKFLYKVTYIEERLAKSWVYDRYGTTLDDDSKYWVSGVTFHDPLQNYFPDYFPFYFEKSLEMPDFIQLPESVKKYIEDGSKLDNFGWKVNINLF